MFENIYGLSCIENQVLAQLKLQGMNISALYGASNIDLGKLFYQMVVKGEKPECFSAAPKIQDVLKELGVISLQLKTDTNIISVFDMISNEKKLIKVKPDFVKSKLYARGLRSDHYVLVEKTDDEYKLFNDIPETMITVKESELQNIYDGNYFLLKILRDLPDNDSSCSFKKDKDKYNYKMTFPILPEILEQINDIGVKVRNFFWIYKILLYRLTEYCSPSLSAEVINEKRNMADNMFARSEYLNLKKSTDIIKYCDLINEAYRAKNEIISTLNGRSA